MNESTNAVRQEIATLVANLTMDGVRELIWELDRRFQNYATSEDAQLVERILKLSEQLSLGEQVDLKVVMEERNADNVEWLRGELEKGEDDFANGRCSTADEVFARLGQEPKTGTTNILISQAAEDDSEKFCGPMSSHETSLAAH